MPTTKFPDAGCHNKPAGAADRGLIQIFLTPPYQCTAVKFPYACPLRAYWDNLVLYGIWMSWKRWPTNGAEAAVLILPIGCARCSKPLGICCPHLNVHFWWATGTPAAGLLCSRLAFILPWLLATLLQIQSPTIKLLLYLYMNSGNRESGSCSNVL